MPQVERFGEAWILNPGSPTERRAAQGHSMLVLRIVEGVVEPKLVPL